MIFDYYDFMIRISLGEVCEDIRISGLIFSFKKFQFEFKSNFVEKNL